MSLLGTVIALDRYSTEYCGDLSKPEELAQTIRALKPNIIVNAAAYTAVDRAESEADLAHQINADTLAVISQEAEQLGAWLVHYSTDYVFDGSGVQPWHEEHTPAPLNVYGQTKLAGEQAIQASGCKHLIFRTSWVYAARGDNFAKTMLRLATERKQLNVISDQVGAPTGAELIADVTAHCLRMIENNEDVSGLYHLAASGEVSWHGYADFVIAQARNAGKKLAVQQILAIKTVDYPTSAQRPLNSRLNCSKLCDTFSLHLASWEDGVQRLLSEYKEY